MHEHVILVAFTVEDETRKEAERTLTGVLPRPGFVIESWWVAEDERYDRSDNDSAVFVRPGFQREAVALLREHGLAH